MADLERHPQPLAQFGAVALVLSGAVAQAVVDVQDADRGTAADPYREIEQAGGVAATGQQHHDRAAALQQADPVRADHSSPRWRAMKISVDSLNPFSRTSPIRSNRRCEPDWSTTGRVTSTSPPRERAATREAMLTSRP